jgi:hypothetical protein
MRRVEVTNRKAFPGKTIYSNMFGVELAHGVISMDTIVRSRQIGMLQVDLNRHSELSAAMAPGLLMEAKMKLATDLEHGLLSRRLRRLYWAGDGGIFRIECTREDDFDAVVLSGEHVFRVLSSVNGLYADRFPKGYSLKLRVSGHFGSILTVREPRFWHGKELNFFAKYERELSAPGMFAITRQLREMLSQDQRMKFPDSRMLAIGIAGETIDVYFHQRYGGFPPVQQDVKVMSLPS